MGNHLYASIGCCVGLATWREGERERKISSLSSKVVFPSVVEEREREESKYPLS